MLTLLVDKSRLVAKSKQSNFQYLLIVFLIATLSKILTGNLALSGACWLKKTLAYVTIDVSSDVNESKCTIYFQIFHRSRNEKKYHMYVHKGNFNMSCLET